MSEPLPIPELDANSVRWQNDLFRGRRDVRLAIGDEGWMLRFVPDVVPFEVHTARLVIGGNDYWVYLDNRAGKPVLP